MATTVVGRCTPCRAPHRCTPSASAPSSTPLDARPAATYRYWSGSTSVWNYIDWMAQCLLMVNLVLWVTIVIMTALWSVPDRPTTLDAGAVNVVETILSNFDSINIVYSIYGGTNVISLLFMIVRLLKSLNYHPKLAIVSNTIAIAAEDLLHFSIVFTVVLCVYAFMGMVIAGRQVRSSLRVILQDSDAAASIAGFRRCSRSPYIEHATASSGLASSFRFRSPSPLASTRARFALVHPRPASADRYHSSRSPLPLRALSCSTCLLLFLVLRARSIPTHTCAPRRQRWSNSQRLTEQ